MNPALEVFPRPLTDVNITSKSIRNFWKKVVKQPGCWRWNAHKMKKGYGRVSVLGVKILAHRFSWMIHYGKIPNGMGVLHRCDNPECVRPDHLFIGTVMDNIRDRDRKGRQVTVGGKNHWSAKHPELVKRGSKHHNSILNECSVKEIRKIYKSGKMSYEKIAIKFGTSKSNIHFIVSGMAWRHIL
jgi:hypothetical protein